MLINLFNYTTWVSVCRLRVFCRSPEGLSSPQEQKKGCFTAAFGRTAVQEVPDEAECNSQQPLAGRRWKLNSRGFEKLCVCCLGRSKWEIDPFTQISGDSSQDQLLNGFLHCAGMVATHPPTSGPRSSQTCCRSLAVLFQLTRFVPCS